MKTVVNNLAAEISVTPLVKKTEDLRVTVTLSNESQSTMRLNAMYLNAPTLRLRFVDAKGAPVATGPPPTPRPDDGKSGRVELGPGKSITVTFEGAAIFSSPLPEGKYWVSFRYRNEGSAGDWVGVAETPRVGFEVTGS